MQLCLAHPVIVFKYTYFWIWTFLTNISLINIYIPILTRGVPYLLLFVSHNIFHSTAQWVWDMLRLDDQFRMTAPGCISYSLPRGNLSKANVQHTRKSTVFNAIGAFRQSNKLCQTSKEKNRTQDEHRKLHSIWPWCITNRSSGIEHSCILQL